MSPAHLYRLYRRLVPLPADLAGERRAFLARIERVVWLAVIGVNLLMLLDSIAIDLAPHPQLVELAWHALIITLPSLIATVAINRFAFAQSVAMIRQQEALRQGSERFERQFRAMPVPAYCWHWRGDDFYLEDYNTAAETITQGEIGRMVGGSLASFYRDRPDIQADLHTALREQRAITRETPYRFRTTGDVRELEITYMFVPPDLVVVHTVDHTERVAREQVERARTRLEGAQLAARTATHEINNALSPVSGFAELLTLEPAIQREPRLAEYARLIHEGAQDAAAKANRLQRIVRLEEDTTISAGAATVLDVERSTAATLAAG